MGQGRVKIKLSSLYGVKRFGKNEEQIDPLVNSLHLCNTGIGVEFGLKKCGIFTLKKGKIMRRERIKLPDGQK